jgi:lipid A disaccharide synthetase
MTNRKKIFIIAGEASGDILGASLARELLNSDCVIKGIGGEMMVKSGCKIAF